MSAFQEKAAKQVDAFSLEQLDHWLSSIPEAKREELAPLVASTHEPVKKMAIWAAYHRSEAKNQGRRLHRDSRFATNASQEVTQEFQALMEEKNTSRKPLTEAQVQAVIDRKELELAMEMRHGVVFSNEGGRRANGSRIIWTKEELSTIEGTLQAVPEAHMGKNPKLQEMIREDVDPAHGYSAMHGADHKIHVYDGGAGTEVKTDGATNVGNQRELVGRECPHCGLVLKNIDMSIAHEMGHAVHENDTKGFAAFQKLTGWKNLDKGALADAKLTSAEIASLDEARRARVGWDKRPRIEKQGKIYTLDPYSDGYLVVDAGAIPEAGEHSLAEKGAPTDHAWDYSRTSPKEHFAEIYSKAITVPKQLHNDLVVIPQRMVDDARAAVGAAPDAAAKRAAQAKLDRALQAQRLRGQEFHLMRDEVFDADAEVDAAQARLSAKGISVDAIRKFRQDADKASTPQQVRVIEASYRGGGSSSGGERKPV